MKTIEFLINFPPPSLSLPFYLFFSASASRSRQFKCKGCSFDASIPISASASKSIIESSSILENQATNSVVDQPVSHQPPSTTIFPSTSSSSSNSAPPNVNHNRMKHNTQMPTLQNGPLEPNPVQVPLMVAPPPAPVMEVMIGAEGFSQEGGGQPLMVDRVILGVLILLIALIVRKIA